MTQQFSPLSTYSHVPPTTLAGADQFDSACAPAEMWPLLDGCAARTGRSASPLLQDRFLPAWTTPLADGASPTSLLFGGGLIVVEGNRRSVLSYQGELCASFAPGPYASWFDVSGPRLIVDAPAGGLHVVRLPGGTVESSIALSFPSGHFTGALLPGPDHTLLLLTFQRTSAGVDDVVVEVVRVRDWKHIEDGYLYGLDLIAGMIRDGDWAAEAALARTGPVFATRDGILWCDWQLHPIAEHLHSLHPRALSVDGAGRAFVIGDDDLLHPQLVIAPPGGPALAVHPLPGAKDFTMQPALLAGDGSSYLLTPGEILALSPDGQVSWRLPCGPNPHGSLSSNGLLLLADEALYAVGPAGDRTLLWKPPSPIVTAPILFGSRIIVAAADRVFMLQGDG